jgi:hypothetical protein
MSDDDLSRIYCRDYATLSIYEIVTTPTTKHNGAIASAVTSTTVSTLFSAGTPIPEFAALKIADTGLRGILKSELRAAYCCDTTAPS